MHDYTGITHGHDSHSGPLSGISRILSSQGSQSAHADITGLARVIDGDTIEVAGERIRIYGIDAPELGQTCKDEQGEFPCGQQVKGVLETLLTNRPVTCHQKDRDRYGRIVAVCFYDTNVDLGRDLVRHGWAMAYQKYSKDYVADEAHARKLQFGLWVGEFQPPWEWRRGKR